MVCKRETTLDAIRGIAIFLILLFHFRVLTGVDAIDRIAAPVADIGWVGVDLFFVLSGFLVGRVILTAAASPSGFDRIRFLQRRMLRLWPVLFLYLATIVATGGMAGFAMVLPVLLHVQNYTGHIPSHLWSLAVEEQFYIVAAIAVPLVLGRFGPRWLGIIFVGIMIASTASRMGAWLAGVEPRHLQWQTQYRIDAITLGLLLAWMEIYRPEWLAAFVRYRLLNLAIAITGFVLVAVGTDDSSRFGPGLIAADVASAALLLAFLGASIPARLTIPARWMAALGGIAYPLYIWHPSIAQLTDVLARALGMGAPLPVTLLRYAGSIAIATLIAVFVERPMMRLGNARYASPRPRRLLV